nr:uncharacterized protein LOC106623875 [Bactrocera oleae]
MPSCYDCYNWLNRNCQYLETCSNWENSKVTQRDCKLLAKMRFDWVKQTGACINCLRKGHTVSKCPTKSHCRICHQSHHSHLHFATVGATNYPFVHKLEPKEKDQTPVSFPSSNPSHHSPTNPSVSLIACTRKRAIIPTALIYIQDKFGEMQPARALLDSCSELNFITEETVKRLQLKRFFSHQKISGISDVRSNSKYAVNAKIKSRIGDFTCISQFAITKQITPQIPSSFINNSKWDIDLNIQLADPYFYKL